MAVPHEEASNCVAAMIIPHVVPHCLVAMHKTKLVNKLGFRLHTAPPMARQWQWHAGQPQGPPLRMATDQEVLQHLWTG